MDAAATLPHVTASLNGVALTAALAGFGFIRSGRRDLHRAAMLAAVFASALFLAVYVVYHFAAPIFQFRGTGWVRPVYYGLLVAHVLLAAIAAPMILITLARALRGRYDAHSRLARWTWPLWVFVSASGLVVYAMLYHLYT